MRLKTLPSEFQKALPILSRIKEAGYEAYFVGGSVRDAILERPIHDVDIATSAYPEEIKKIFPRTVDVGIEHGTVLVLVDEEEYEITTFRTEEAYVDFRRPSQVHFVRSLKEDLKRRDFTVNAFALNNDSEVIDLFGGLLDLEKKTLRAVGDAKERFNEDALRIMRGLRFVSSLGFSIEEKTFSAMMANAKLLEKISVERIFIELDKLLMAPFWRKGLEQLLSSDVYHFLPELKNSKESLQLMLDEMTPSFQFETSEQAWADLVMSLQVKSIKNFLKKWKTSNDFQKAVENLIAIYQIRLKRDVSRQDVYRFGKDTLYQVESLREAKSLTYDRERISNLDSELTIHDKSEIVVNGRQLMAQYQLSPGPRLGRILNDIETEIVEGHLENTQEEIFRFVERRLVIE
ncbi:CCA tRNA nucleotidyltransferase [Streptococcus sp. CSL10205-OR2]|uniref:CCA tRNA nucleotidyltransferase n=1 Tax=Streptococcus sp. CSL10205-OR2 TaxID=2980558 RepID=UPI0021DABB1B|nr:CCA tRNA nucleotidyltransferase [Streptococcus sp. CSL10205-OR2]MCU9534373.1 CCA tRNA nucleotidyltransferase [Streptococcus sp. CSL10205-OR2]